MQAKEVKTAMSRAFRDLARNLGGVFVAYDSDPEMVEAVAHVLKQVYRAQVAPLERGRRARRRAIHRLLCEIAGDEVPADRNAVGPASRGWTNRRPPGGR